MSSTYRIVVELDGVQSEIELFQINDGRFVVPDGTGAQVNDGIFMHGAGRGGITVLGPLSYFGGGTQDVFKISSQGAGTGTVILAINEALDDYKPFQIRGETVELRYRIPNPNDPNGHSTVHASGLKLDADGNINIAHNIRLNGTLNFEGPYSCVLAHPYYGLVINDSENAMNLVIIDTGGNIFSKGLTGASTLQSGDKYVVVGADGKLRKSAVGPTS